MKTIKPIFKFWILSGLMIGVNNSYAQYSWNAIPYFGADYKVSYTEGRDYWKKILPTNKVYQHVSLFTGFQFHDCLAGEVGYSGSFKLTKHSDVSNLTMWAGAAPSNSIQDIKLSYQSWYMDLNILYPNEGSLSLLATLGAASSKPKIFAQNVSGDTSNNPIVGVVGRSKLVPRLGLGVQFAKGFFGMRSKIIWEDTSKLKFDTALLNTRLPGVTVQGFKGSYVWSLGLFFRL